MATPSEGKRGGSDGASLIPFVSTGCRPGKGNDGPPTGRNDVERTLIVHTKTTSSSIHALL